MRNLLEFLGKYSYWFLFLLLEAISLVLLFRFNSYQSSVWYTSANAVTAKTARLYSDAMAYLSLGSINADLTERNVVLQAENDRLRLALAEAQPDTSLTAERVAKALAGYRLIPATVTSASVRNKDNYLVIDKGETAGIRPEMGVVGGGGVVGIVANVGESYSRVVPVINSKSSISCRVRGSQYFGYMKWQGGSPLVAQITDIPRYANPKPGVTLETSGYSSVFPPGIFVGKAIKISDSSDGLAYTMDVNLGTDFRRLRDVMVIASEYKPQVDSLYRAAKMLSDTKQ